MGAERKRSSGRLIAASSDEVFCCDADSLIDLERAGLAKHLNKLVRAGLIKVPKGVNRELQRRADKLAERIRKWNQKYAVVVDLDHDPTALEHVARVAVRYGPPFAVHERRYRGFWKSASAWRAADPEVVALAKSRGWVVISNDETIHGACMVEMVACRRWEEIGRLIFQQGTLPLFATEGNPAPP